MSDKTQIAAAREASEARWEAIIDAAADPARKAAAREAAEAADEAWEVADDAMADGDDSAALGALSRASQLARKWGGGDTELGAMVVIMERRRRWERREEAALLVRHLGAPKLRRLREALAGLVGLTAGGREYGQALQRVFDELPDRIRIEDVIDEAMGVESGRHAWRPEVAARLGEEPW